MGNATCDALHFHKFTIYAKSGVHVAQAFLSTWRLFLPSGFSVFCHVGSWQLTLLLPRSLSMEGFIVLIKVSMELQRPMKEKCPQQVFWLF